MPVFGQRTLFVPASLTSLVDGGCYQGIASLLILDAFMKSIPGGSEGKQQQNRSSTRPCDMFDVIGGVGSGGSVPPSRPGS
jgi:hypothetical protein